MGATIDGEGRAEAAKANGLITDHAYSILQVVQISSAERMVELRNPYGAGMQWKGKWRNGDPLWTEHPNVAKQCVHGADDGTFWLEWADFLKEFDSVSICPKNL